MIKVLKQNKKLFDIFTRKEEYDAPILDKYKRFPNYLRSGTNILEPEVSKFLINNGLKIQYQDNKRFGVCLTHDVDFINYPYLNLLYGSIISLTQGKIKDALKMPFYRINKKWNPLWNFKEIMALEEKYQAKSSFYFMALNKNNMDFNYEAGALGQEIGDIADNGWEIGLHGGHESYNNLDEINLKKKILENILGKKVIGYRNHFLKFKVPNTWELLSKAGFKYDTTLGFADCVGFRNGMCHPFKPYNSYTNSEIDILEIPLMIMDRTLFDYMKLDINGAWKITKLIIDTVEKYNGVVTILWHNSSMRGNEIKLYEKILKYSNQKGAWITSAEEIWKWFDKDGI